MQPSAPDFSVGKQGNQANFPYPSAYSREGDASEILLIWTGFVMATLHAWRFVRTACVVTINEGVKLGARLSSEPVFEQLDGLQEPCLNTCLERSTASFGAHTVRSWVGDRNSKDYLLLK